MLEIGIVNSLISHGCDINKQDDQEKTALSYACASPNKEIISALLENGASPDDLDTSELTPLMCMLQSPNFEYEMVKMLMDHGARFVFLY